MEGFRTKSLALLGLLSLAGESSCRPSDSSSVLLYDVLPEVGSSLSPGSVLECDELFLNPCGVWREYPPFVMSNRRTRVEFEPVRHYLDSISRELKNVHRAYQNEKKAGLKPKKCVAEMMKGINVHMMERGNDGTYLRRSHEIKKCNDHINLGGQNVVFMGKEKAGTHLDVHRKLLQFRTILQMYTGVLQRVLDSEIKVFEESHESKDFRLKFLRKVLDNHKQILCEVDTATRQSLGSSPFVCRVEVSQEGREDLTYTSLLNYFTIMQYRDYINMFRKYATNIRLV